MTDFIHRLRAATRSLLVAFDVLHDIHFSAPWTDPRSH